VLAGSSRCSFPRLPCYRQRHPSPDPRAVQGIQLAPVLGAYQADEELMRRAGVVSSYANYRLPKEASPDS
jgi:hypothetical protein